MMPKQERACLNFERTSLNVIAGQMENFAEKKKMGAEPF